MTGAELMIRCLEREGVEYVFGVPGEETLDLNEALFRKHSSRGHATQRLGIPGASTYSVCTTCAGQLRASTVACHSLIVPSLAITPPTRCAPLSGLALAP